LGLALQVYFSIMPLRSGYSFPAMRYPKEVVGRSLDFRTHRQFRRISFSPLLAIWSSSGLTIPIIRQTYSVLGAASCGCGIALASPSEKPIGDVSEFEIKTPRVKAQRARVS